MSREREERERERARESELRERVRERRVERERERERRDSCYPSLINLINQTEIQILHKHAEAAFIRL